eukprot:TRINITY_DN9317_c0_g1_i3.p1 TRINITY_DN9317_c0_g1~~TRINITY_DN9317_c0_g1_i3.p1  ORF type:complete len:3717 (+),score=673.72 TRINITY_DN9317_c0_g1_i3:112-11262(+)
MHGKENKQLVNLITEGSAVKLLRDTEPTIRQAALRYLKQIVNIRPTPPFAQPIKDVASELLFVSQGDESLENRLMAALVLGRFSSQLAATQHTKFCASILHRLAFLINLQRMQLVGGDGASSTKNIDDCDSNLQQEVIYLWSTLTPYLYSCTSMADTCFHDGTFNMVVYLIHESLIYFPHDPFMRLAVFRVLNRGIFRSSKTAQSIWPAFSHIAAKMRKGSIPEAVKEGTEFLAFWGSKAADPDHPPEPELDCLTVLCSGMKEAVAVLPTNCPRPVDLVSEVAEFEKAIKQAVKPFDAIFKNPEYGIKKATMTINQDNPLAFEMTTGQHPNQKIVQLHLPRNKDVLQVLGRDFAFMPPDAPNPGDDLSDDIDVDDADFDEIKGQMHGEILKVRRGKDSGSNTRHKDSKGEAMVPSDKTPDGESASSTNVHGGSAQDDAVSWTDCSTLKSGDHVVFELDTASGAHDTETSPGVATADKRWILLAEVEDIPKSLPSTKGGKKHNRSKREYSEGNRLDRNDSFGEDEKGSSRSTPASSSRSSSTSHDVVPQAKNATALDEELELLLHILHNEKKSDFRINVLSDNKSVLAPPELLEKVMVLHDRAVFLEEPVDVNQHLLKARRSKAYREMGTVWKTFIQDQSTSSSITKPTDHASPQEPPPRAYDSGFNIGIPESKKSAIAGTIQRKFHNETQTVVRSLRSQLVNETFRSLTIAKASETIRTEKSEENAVPTNRISFFTEPPVLHIQSTVNEVRVMINITVINMESRALYMSAVIDPSDGLFVEPSSIMARPGSHQTPFEIIFRPRLIPSTTCNIMARMLISSGSISEQDVCAINVFKGPMLTFDRKEIDFRWTSPDYQKEEVLSITNNGNGTVTVNCVISSSTPNCFMVYPESMIIPPRSTKSCSVIFSPGDDEFYFANVGFGCDGGEFHAIAVKGRCGLPVKVYSTRYNYEEALRRSQEPKPSEQQKLSDADSAKKAPFMDNKTAFMSLHGEGPRTTSIFVENVSSEVQEVGIHAPDFFEPIPFVPLRPGELREVRLVQKEGSALPIDDDFQMTVKVFTKDLLLTGIKVKSISSMQIQHLLTSPAYFPATTIGATSTIQSVVVNMSNQTVRLSVIRSPETLVAGLVDCDLSDKEVALRPRSSIVANFIFTPKQACVAKGHLHLTATFLDGSVAFEKVMTLVGVGASLDLSNKEWWETSVRSLTNVDLIPFSVPISLKREKPGEASRCPLSTYPTRIRMHWNSTRKSIKNVYTEKLLISNLSISREIYIFVSPPFTVDRHVLLVSETRPEEVTLTWSFHPPAPDRVQGFVLVFHVQSQTFVCVPIEACKSFHVISPKDTVIFPNLKHKETLTEQLVIFNISTGIVNWTSTMDSQATRNAFSLSSKGGSIDALSPYPTTVVFSPKDEGHYRSAVMLSVEGAAEWTKIGLQGFVGKAVLKFSQPRLYFGKSSVGVLVNMLLRFTNVGNETGRVTFRAPRQFEIPSITYLVDPEDSRDVFVEMKGEALGLNEGFIEVICNDDVVRLPCSIITEIMNVRILQARPSIKFGHVYLGQRLEQNLTILNDGTQPIELVAVTHSAGVYPGEVQIQMTSPNAKVVYNVYEEPKVCKDHWLFLKSSFFELKGSLGAFEPRLFNLSWSNAETYKADLKPMDVPPLSPKTAQSYRIIVKRAKPGAFRATISFHFKVCGDAFEKVTSDLQQSMSLSLDGDFTQGLMVFPKIIDYGKRPALFHYPTNLIQTKSRDNVEVVKVANFSKDKEEVEIFFSNRYFWADFSRWTIHPGEILDVPVFFAPEKDRMNYSCELTIKSRDRNRYVGMRGRGISADVRLPVIPSIEFGSTRLYGHSRKFVPFDNVGEMPADWEVTVNSDSGFFTLVGGANVDASGTLKEGGSYKIGIEFSPKYEGKASGVFVFKYRPVPAAGWIATQIPLGGYTSAPKFQLERNIIDFGTTLLFMTSEIVVRLLNRGDVECEWKASSDSSSFDVVPRNGMVEAESKVDVVIRCTPASYEVTSCNIHFESHGAVHGLFCRTLVALPRLQVVEGNLFVDIGAIEVGSVYNESFVLKNVSELDITFSVNIPFYGCKDLDQKAVMDDNDLIEIPDEEVPSISFFPTGYTVKPDEEVQVIVTCRPKQFNHYYVCRFLLETSFGERFSGRVTYVGGKRIIRFLVNDEEYQQPMLKYSFGTLLCGDSFKEPLLQIVNDGNMPATFEIQASEEILTHDSSIELPSLVRETIINKTRIAKNHLDLTASYQTIPPKSAITVLTGFFAGLAGSFSRTFEVTSQERVVQVSLRGESSYPQISTAPVELDFGVLKVWEQKSCDIVLHNDGGVAVDITFLFSEKYLSGLKNRVVEQVSPSQIRLDPKCTETVTISMTGKHPGKVEDKLRMQYLQTTHLLPLNALIGDESYKLYVNQVEFSTGSELDFGTLMIGETTWREIILVNTGNFPLDVDLVWDDQVTELVSKKHVQLAEKVAPRRSHNFVVGYLPRNNGDFSGIMYLVVNKARRPIPYVGTVGMYDWELQGKPVTDYGKVSAGYPTPVVFSVRNTGAYAITVRVSPPPTEEKITIRNPGSVPNYIGPGETVQFEYEAIPAIPSQNRLEFKIQPVGENSNLRPIEVAAILGADKPVIEFDNAQEVKWDPYRDGQSMSFSRTLSNVSGENAPYYVRMVPKNGNLVVEPKSVGKPSLMEGWTVDSPKAVLSPGESREITFHYRPPTANRAAAEGYIQFVNPISNTLHMTIPLRHHTQSAKMEISEHQLFFGRVNVGEKKSKTVFISNKGEMDLKLKYRLSGTSFNTQQYLIEPAPTSLSLVPGAQVQLLVSYLPQESGQNSATILIESNDSNRLVAITGIGVEQFVSFLDLAPETNIGQISLGRLHTFELQVNAKVAANCQILFRVIPEDDLVCHLPSNLITVSPYELPLKASQDPVPVKLVFSTQGPVPEVMEDLETAGFGLAYETFKEWFSEKPYTSRQFSAQLLIEDPVAEKEICKKTLVFRYKISRPRFHPRSMVIKFQENDTESKKLTFMNKGDIQIIVEIISIPIGATASQTKLVLTPKTTQDVDFQISNKMLSKDRYRIEYQIEANVYLFDQTWFLEKMAIPLVVCKIDQGMTMEEDTHEYGYDDNYLFSSSESSEEEDTADQKDESRPTGQRKSRRPHKVGGAPPGVDEKNLNEDPDGENQVGQDQDASHVQRKRGSKSKNVSGNGQGSAVEDGKSSELNQGNGSRRRRRTKKSIGQGDPGEFGEWARRSDHESDDDGDDDDDEEDNSSYSDEDDRETGERRSSGVEGEGQEGDAGDQSGRKKLLRSRTKLLARKDSLASTKELSRKSSKPQLLKRASTKSVIKSGSRTTIHADSGDSERGSPDKRQPKGKVAEESITSVDVDEMVPSASDNDEDPESEIARENRRKSSVISGLSKSTTKLKKVLKKKRANKKLSDVAECGPVISLDKSAGLFLPTATNGAEENTLHIENHDSIPITITLESQDPSFSVSSSETIVPPSGVGIIKVRYNPKTPGSHESRLIVKANGVEIDEVTLKGSSKVAMVEFSQSEIDFGFIPPASWKESRLTVYNTGDVSVTFCPFSDTAKRITSDGLKFEDFILRCRPEVLEIPPTQHATFKFAIQSFVDGPVHTSITLQSPYRSELSYNFEVRGVGDQIKLTQAGLHALKEKLPFLVPYELGHDDFDFLIQGPSIVAPVSMASVLQVVEVCSPYPKVFQILIVSVSTQKNN